MDSFLISLIQVAIMLAYAVPGFIFVKAKAVNESSISSFAKVLMYLCQPCLTLYAFNSADYSVGLFKNSAIVFAIGVITMLVFIFIFYFALNKKSSIVRYRVYNIATCFGNTMFMGLPLLTKLFPHNSEVAVYSAMFFVGMSLLGWTLAAAIITRDKKYINWKKILLNPAIICLVIALPLFCTGTKLPGQIDDMVTILGKMSTPLCMIIMGMRLGAVKTLKNLLLPWSQYVFIAVKLLVYPLFAFPVIAFLPIDGIVKAAVFVMCCCPIASVVQTYSEMLGEGQEESANLVVLSTILSVLTIPLLSLMIPLLL